MRFFRHPDKMISYTGWLQLYTAILSVATAALVGATIYNVIVLNSTDEKIGRQTEVASKQLAQMQAEQRPWLKTEVRLTQPIISNEHMISINGMVRVTNVGHMPAANVGYFSQGLPLDHRESPLIFQREKCEAERSKQANDDSGNVLFPGDWIDFGLGAGFGSDSIKKGLHTQPKVSLGPDGRANIDVNGPAYFESMVIGCVTYQVLVEGDRPAHQTRFGLSLQQIRPEIFWGLDPQRENTPVSDVLLHPMPGFSFAD